MLYSTDYVMAETCHTELDLDLEHTMLLYSNPGVTVAHGEPDEACFVSPILHQQPRH